MFRRFVYFRLQLATFVLQLAFILESALHQQRNQLQCLWGSEYSERKRRRGIKKASTEASTSTCQRNWTKTTSLGGRCSKGRGGEGKTRSVIGGGWRGTPTGLQGRYCFRNAATYQWSAQSESRRFFAEKAVRANGFPISCFSFLLVSRKCQNTKTFKGQKRRKEVAKLEND